MSYKPKASDGGLYTSVENTQQGTAARAVAAHKGSVVANPSNQYEISTKENLDVRGFSSQSGTLIPNKDIINSLKQQQQLFSDLGTSMSVLENFTESSGKSGSLKILKDMPYKQKLIALANLDDGIDLFKSKNGSAAISLAENTKTWGIAAKGIGGVGLAVFAYEEFLYIKEIRLQAPEKRNIAIASSVVNIAGAWIGAFGGPIAWATVPIGTVIGGAVGHYFYDNNAKGLIRHSYVGEVPDIKK